MQCKSLWIKASAKCINVNVTLEHMRAIMTPNYDIFCQSFVQYINASILLVSSPAVDCRLADIWTDLMPTPVKCDPT